MKKLLALFFIVSFLCFGADTPDNKNTDKSVQMKEEIGLLKNQIIDLRSELREVIKKDNKDQVYSDSLKYYKRAKDDANEIYRLSTNDAKDIFNNTITLIMSLIAGAGALLLALLTYIQFNNKNQLEKERKILEKLKEDTEKKIKEFNDKINDVEFNSKFGIAINKNDSKEKLTELKTLEKEIDNLSKKNKIMLYFELGNNSLEIKEGINYFSSAIKLSPNYLAAYINRGNLKAKNNKNYAATKDFDKAIELDPLHSAAYINRGILKSDNHNFIEAIEDFDKAIELEPENAYFYYNRALTKVAKKDYNQAIEDYNQAIHLESKNGNFYYSRGIAKLKIKEAKDFDSMIKDFDKAIEFNPRDDRSYYSRGVAKARKGDSKKNIVILNEALRDFDRAEQLKAQTSSFYSNRAIIQTNKKSFSEALKDLNIAIELEPQNGLFYFQRSSLQIEKEDFVEALRDLNSAFDLNYRNPDLYNNRSEVLLMLKKYKLAINDLIHFLKITKEYKLRITISQKIYDEFKKYLEDLVNKNGLEQEVYNKLLAKAEGGFTIIEE